MKQLSGTRYKSKEGYEQVQEAIDISADDTIQTPETRGDASGLATHMDELYAGIMAELWYEILRHVNKVNLSNILVSHRMLLSTF